jgi:hypothetical protein
VSVFVGGKALQTNGRTRNLGNNGKRGEFEQLARAKKLEWDGYLRSLTQSRGEFIKSKHRVKERFDTCLKKLSMK